MNSLIDDRRLQLPEGNLFRFAQPNGLPKIDMEKRTSVDFSTAKEIQRKRVQAKKAKLAAK